MDNVQYYNARFRGWDEQKSSRTWRYVAAGVLAVMFVGPVLIPAAAIAALIWGKRAFTAPIAMMRNWQDSSGGSIGGDGSTGRHRGWGWGCGGGSHRGGPHRRHQSTGNQAFDAYKADTLRRLEEEQEQFESFLARLREAKDKSEFDAFMNEQANRKSDPADDKPGSLDEQGPVDAKR